MKVPVQWLKDWIEVPWAPRELGARLTMAGLELEAIEGQNDGQNQYQNDSDNAAATLELGITPNRGDAMSIRGVAREVAALSGGRLKTVGKGPVAAQIEDRFPVKLTASGACPKFAGRLIRGVNVRAASPAWLRERLQYCGVRSINPIVDVTNYVMLELGTPMHAYDAAKLQGGIEVRFATAGETLRLLDGQEVTFDAKAAGEMLLITDAAGAVGFAGVMGGERTSVSDTTTDVFFEVAYFKPQAVSAGARRFGLITDAAQRFERGVDAQALEYALERASELLIEIAGGRPGPVQVTAVNESLPQSAIISLRRRQLARLIGMNVPDDKVLQILQSLGMQVTANADGWTVKAPSHRSDLTIEADLIEEVARIVGYDAIPEAHARVAQVFDVLQEARLQPLRALQLLADRGYQEAITYSFVDPQLQGRLFPDAAQLTLRNPIAANMAAMRVSLWPGLLQAAGENLRRQQDRVRLMEYGNKFALAGGTLTEITTLAGIAAGGALQEQWGEKTRAVDFFDVKADVQAVLDATGCADEFQFQPPSSSHAQPCLHPGRAACILRAGAPVGWLGELHPELVKALDLTYAPTLFELETIAALNGQRAAFKEISKYPSLRRDLALIVDEAVSVAALREQVSLAAGDLLRDFIVFDVYRGPGVDSGRKSIALGLILQETSRTLADHDADRIVGAVIERLRREMNASIRA